MDASPFPFDPYASPSAPQRRERGLEYFEAYSFYFNHPNWFLNLLLVTLCQFIPIVGPIVVLGYEYELILAKHLRTTRTYPDFDFGRFADYLTRGIWPFLVQMILSLVLAPILIVGLFVGMAVVGAMSGAASEPTVMLAIFPIMALFIAALTVFSALVMTPLSLRAGLTRDFGQAFDLDWVKDFIQRVGWETVLAMGFLMIAGIVVALLGLLACFVGIYPATTLTILAYTHLKWQLYELYLARGGMPIPLPEDDIVQAERV